jgi:hypothetical protein
MVVGQPGAKNVGNVPGESTDATGDISDTMHVAAVLCPPGHFYSKLKQRCQSCAKGSYSAGGAVARCKKCHPHYTTPTTGAVSPDECTGCAPGYGSRTDSPSCVCGPCFLGSYSGEGLTNATNALVCSYGVNNTPNNLYLEKELGI